ncbi:MAG: Ldh family oxidoreductase [Clostridia bacterium]|nr:Ldh family oxidoreductase [Clostridia bacterium]
MLCEILRSKNKNRITSNHTHINGKGGTCHGFMAIDPKIFGDEKGMQERFSTFLQELRDATKAEGQPRIYTHGEKEVFAYADRMKNGIDVNINTVAEMKDLCDYLDMDSVKYLGNVDFSEAKQSSYK